MADNKIVSLDWTKKETEEKKPILRTDHPILRTTGGIATRVAAPPLGAYLGGSLGALAGPEGIPIGALLGAILAGGGSEAAAEKYIDMGTGKVNPYHVGINAAVSGIPASYLVRSGRPLVSAGLGALLGYTSTGATNMSEGEPASSAFNPLNHKLEYALGMGLPAAMGAGLSYLPKVKVEGVPPPEAPTGPQPPKGQSGLRVAANDIRKTRLSEQTTNTRTPTSKQEIVNQKALAEEINKNPSGPIAKELKGPTRVYQDMQMPKDADGNIIVAPPDMEAAHDKAISEAIVKPAVATEKAHAVANKMNATDASDEVAAQLEEATLAEKARLAEIKRINDEATALAASQKPLAAAENTLNKLHGNALEANKGIDAKDAAKTAATELKTNKQSTAEIARDQKNLADVEAWAAKRAEAAKQQSNIDTLKTGENIETVDGPVRETSRGKGPNGEAQSQTTTYREKPPPPKPTDEGDAGAAPVEPVTPVEPKGPPPSKIFNKRSNAEDYADRNGGANEMNVVQWGTKSNGRPQWMVHHRSVEPGEPPVSIPPPGSVRLNEAQNNSLQLDEPTGPAKTAAEAMQRARPYSQLSEEDQMGLVPYLHDAVNKGYKGDLEVIADELADKLNMTREGLDEAKRVGATSDELVKFIRSKGGFNLSKEKNGGYTGELKWVKENFNGNKFRSGARLVNTKSGLSVDGMLEALKENPGMFPQISRDNASGLFEALRKSANEPRSGNLMDEFNPPGNWWHKFQPEGEALPTSGLTPEITDFTDPVNQANPPETIDVPVPSAKPEAEPNLPGISGGGGGKPKSLAELPLTLDGGQAPKVSEPPAPTLDFSEQPVEAPVKAPKTSKGVKKAKIEPPIAGLRVGSEQNLRANPQTGETFAGDSPIKPDFTEPLVEGAGVPEKTPLQQTGEDYGAIKDARDAGDIGFEPARSFYGKKASKLNREWQKQSANEVDEIAKATEGMSPLEKQTFLREFLKTVKFGPQDPNEGGGGSTVSAFGAGQGRMLRRAFRNLNEEGPNNSSMLSKLPLWNRGVLLASPTGLPTNAFLAPLGLGWTSAVEKILEGDPAGWALLKQLPSLPKRTVDIMRTGRAANVLEHAPENIAEQLPLGQAKGFMDKAAAWPATLITAGHMGLQDAAIDAGVPAREAADIALSLQPEEASGNAYIRSLGQGLQNLKATRVGSDKTNFLANMFAPFTRTSSEVAAATPSRLPIIGPLLAKMEGDSELPLRSLLARQAISIPASGVSFAAGYATPDEAAPVVRKATRNLGGRYGLITSGMFEAGRAYRNSQNPLQAFGQTAVREIPMPTTEVPTDLLKAGVSLVGGEPKIPRFMIPSALQSSRTSPGLVDFDWTTH